MMHINDLQYCKSLEPIVRVAVMIARGLTFIRSGVHQHFIEGSDGT
jgi:hypothetical protein